jgi:hypothetical protein
MVAEQIRLSVLLGLGTGHKVPAAKTIAWKRGEVTLQRRPVAGREAVRGAERDRSGPAPGRERAPGAEATLTSAVAEPEAARAPGVYAEGILAGLVGAATIAVWFLALDSIKGRPFYTPSVLGTALFRGGAGFENPQALAPNFEMVLSFTWVHVLAFLLIGVAGSRLLALVEFNPNFGFGVVLLFVFFEFGFLFVSMVFAEPVLHELTWPAVLVGNLLAAAAMAAVFWRQHPRLAIRP